MNITIRTSTDEIDVSKNTLKYNKETGNYDDLEEVISKIESLKQEKKNNWEEWFLKFLKTLSELCLYTAIIIFAIILFIYFTGIWKDLLW